MNISRASYSEIINLLVKAEVDPKASIELADKICELLEEKEPETVTSGFMQVENKSNGNIATNINTDVLEQKKQPVITNVIQSAKTILQQETHDPETGRPYVRNTKGEKKKTKPRGRNVTSTTEAAKVRSL